MASNEPFGFDPEDFDRLVRGVGEQMRGALGQFGRLFDGSGERPGWSGLFDESGRRPRSAPAPETTGETGGGVWAIHTVDANGGARVEEVYATELDALRANKHNTNSSRQVRFLPYGIAVSVLDASAESPDS